jgi:hypothetical protein
VEAEAAVALVAMLLQEEQTLYVDVNKPAGRAQPLHQEDDFIEVRHGRDTLDRLWKLVLSRCRSLGAMRAAVVALLDQVSGGGLTRLTGMAPGQGTVCINVSEIHKSPLLLGRLLSKAEQVARLKRYGSSSSRRLSTPSASGDPLLAAEQGLLGLVGESRILTSSSALVCMVSALALSSMSEDLVHVACSTRGCTPGTFTNLKVDTFSDYFELRKVVSLLKFGQEQALPASSLSALVKRVLDEGGAEQVEVPVSGTPLQLEQFLKVTGTSQYVTLDRLVECGWSDGGLCVNYTRDECSGGLEHEGQRFRVTVEVRDEPYGA